MYKKTILQFEGHIIGKAMSVIILLAVLVSVSSCAHYQCDPDYTGPAPRTAEMLEYYSYPKQDIGAKIEKTTEKKHYAISRIEFPSAINIYGKENIKIDYYQQKKPGKYPAVLILPISGGVDFSVKSFARYFASHGINCAVVHNRKADLEDTKSAEEIENYFRQTVLDNRQVLDYLVSRPEVDEDRLGCLGLSLGGIKASLVSGVDERLKCCVFGLAGGSIADITISSGEKEIRNSVKKFLKDDVTPEDIHAELSNKIRTDPLELAEYIDARNVLMYIAAFDMVVPRKCGDKLRQAIGKPETIYFFSGHYGSFLYLPYAEAKSLSFFKKKFGLK
ncbi:MAG: acetylxylan esterase [Sedimentisphaerales bacterium]|nr:acetylxylan esterase [Sedimentisphaerales bacterium]